MANVLIVEDDLMIADNLELILTSGGHDVCGIARNVAEAVHLAQLHRPATAIIDLRLAQGQSGTEVATALREIGPIGVLYATGNPEHPMLQDAYGVGCIGKPYTMDGILAAVEYVGSMMLAAGMPPPVLPKGVRPLQA